MTQPILLKLVEGDTAPDMMVRFPGLNLAEYTTVVMHITYDSGKKVSVVTVPVGVTDPELTAVTWAAGVLIRGLHQAEFEFVRLSDGRGFTLPQGVPLTLQIRKDLR